MHKFVRGEEPVDLEAMRRRHPHWDAFARTAEHTQLGDALYERQAHYCAYCETRITQKENGHIEHLERRSDNPARTFDWANMFSPATTEIPVETTRMIPTPGYVLIRQILLTRHAKIRWIFLLTMRWGEFQHEMRRTKCVRKRPYESFTWTSLCGCITSGSMRP